MKKKILSLCLVLALGATAIIGGTLAYFTDDDAQTNTFTAGQVGINLDEAVVEKNGDGNLVSTGDRTEDTQNYHLYPAMTVEKDPTITVDAGSEDAYVAAIVKVTGDLSSLIGVPGYDNIDITQLVSGGLVDGEATQVFDWNGLSMVYTTDECAIYQDASNAVNNEWTLYIFVNEEMEEKEDVVLFNTMTIPAEWNNAEMAKINNMKIEVNAYATQTNGFDSCFEAVTTAFETEFAAVK